MKTKSLNINSKLALEISEAIHANTTISGLTHNFYRYPARFSNVFARAMIRTFTQPGDVVLDPFMGGGTTLVEAYAFGRQGVGIDINELSAFISKVKTSILSRRDVVDIKSWANTINDRLNMHNIVSLNNHFEYPSNMSHKHVWRIRKAIELALISVNSLKTKKQKQFAKCVLLRTSQWALDCKKNLPTVPEFRTKFIQYTQKMLMGASELSKAVKASGITSEKPTCLCRSSIDLNMDKRIRSLSPPKLVLTSPPYPGVHVLYHRWQIQGRKETSAPYWISGCLDGAGASYYTFGDRKQKNLTDYFDQTHKAFSSISKLLDESSLVVQMVAFSQLSWQLPKYLDVLNNAGLKEVFMSDISNSSDGRIWRTVPNRKWYADSKGQIPSSKEVVLFHKLN